MILVSFVLHKYFHGLPSKVYSFLISIFSFLSLLTGGSFEELEDEEANGVPPWAEEDTTCKPAKDFRSFIVYVAYFNFNCVY